MIENVILSNMYSNGYIKDDVISTTYYTPLHEYKVDIYNKKMNTRFSDIIVSNYCRMEFIDSIGTHILDMNIPEKNILSLFDNINEFLRSGCRSYSILTLDKILEIQYCGKDNIKEINIYELLNNNIMYDKKRISFRTYDIGLYDFLDSIYYVMMGIFS